MQVGIEIEYPRQGEIPRVSAAQMSDGLWRDMSDDAFHVDDGIITHDGTVGLEIVSDPLSPTHARRWFRDTIHRVERRYGEQYEDCGMLVTSNAGTHIHVSPLTTDEAVALYELSMEDWMPLFVCSSVCAKAHSTYLGVFRGNHCNMNFNQSRYSVVNERGRDGHWEWRLPEPMSKEQIGYVVRFLQMLKEGGKQQAKGYALDMLGKRPTQFSAIRRWREYRKTTIDRPLWSREPHDKTDDFWESVATDESMPYILTVLNGDDMYYMFKSSNEGPWTINGRAVSTNTLLDAETLERVQPHEIDLPSPRGASRHLRSVEPSTVNMLRQFE